VTPLPVDGVVGEHERPNLGPDLVDLGVPQPGLAQWIRNYGCAGATIVPLPDEAWAGMSDLSLGATVTESGGGIVVVIDDIRVL
jgi:hypothetical protein